jgi:hypothetical protein
MGQHKYLPLFKHRIHTFTAFKAAARGLPCASLNIVCVQLLILQRRSWEVELCCCAGSLGELGLLLERPVPRSSGFCSETFAQNHSTLMAKTTGPTPAEILWNQNSILAARSQRILQSLLGHDARQASETTTEGELEDEDAQVFKPVPDELYVA